jgi:phenylalanyl-tRNA synthetase alpha chain
MADNLVKKLHPHEKRILIALKKMQDALTADVARESGLPEATVHKAGQWASLKGLVEHDESSKTSAVLTEEGRRYAREGLPEKRLLLMVSKGKSSIMQLKKDLPELDVALAWARRKGWIEVSGKTLRLTGLGRNTLRMITPVERSLRGKIVKETLPELKARKLARLKELKEKRLKLTKKGREILPSIREDKALGQLKPHHIKTGSWRKHEFRPYDVNLPSPVLAPARLHPYTQFINETRRRLISMGFQEARGPWAELEFWNMDALYMPQDHPARGIHDVFRLKKPGKGSVPNRRVLDRVARTHKDGWITGSSGWGSWDQKQTLNLVLRSQTTCVSARTLASGVEEPSMHFTLSRVFRPDVMDSTHSFEFDQLEGIVVGEGLNLRHLMGYLEVFGREVAGAERIRFRPGYFPFTEPSLEMDGYVDGRWVELVGSGIFRPEVTRPLGVDSPVLAWGCGFARLAMIKLGITDIRDLFNHDLEWLRKRKLTLW